jgi:hypothetical protein
VKTKLHQKVSANKRQKGRRRRDAARKRSLRLRQKLAARKRQVERRLDNDKRPNGARPIVGGSRWKFHFDLSDRVQGLAYGGIPLLVKLAQDIGLVAAIDDRLHVLKEHRPYHESDHVLNFAINALCLGDRLEDMERRRNDPGFLDALDAQRLPDPTTAGDFCRRFDGSAVDTLQDIFDAVRIGLWRQQPDAFFDQADIDVDGSLVPTTGKCKQGMDISYDGQWGYHPLIVSLANTREVLRIVNRSGNRPSHEGAAAALDQAIATCLKGGFRRVLLRGDTDFSQTQHLDHWDDHGQIRFIFGYDACAAVKDRANTLPERAWKPLQRKTRPEPKTQARQRPDNVKDRIVRERGYETLRLLHEEVAEFNYQPTACNRKYRMIVVRKNISKEQGDVRLLDEIRYFFYLTNDWVQEADALVESANTRCHQENLIEQLKNGPHALQAPVDALVSNWAYMVMTALAWNLKAWAALRLPETGRWAAHYRAEKTWLLGLEFKTFVNTMVAIPCQMLRQAGQVTFRILSYQGRLSLFLRLAHTLRC